MTSLLIKPCRGIRGRISLSGDKSIAHRCIIASAITCGETEIENFPTNKDCLTTISVFKKLGIRINKKHSEKSEGLEVRVFGKGLQGLKNPQSAVFVGDSGTTLRLILGVLAGQDFSVRLTAGKSLSKRPMLRVTKPLRLMGAQICARRRAQNAKRTEEYPPIIIKGGQVRPITYKMPVASAQVKSAILLAALFAKGRSRVIEPVRTRDHTERILKLFKADIKVIDNQIFIKGQRRLASPEKIYVPGDISSASFFMVAAAILPNSKVLIKNVSINPTRAGIISVLKRMGAKIKIKKSKTKGPEYEPMGDVSVETSKLKGTIVKKKEIPNLIDELPILMVAACFACGRTVLKGIGELRVKETDRIKSMSENLMKMGAGITVVKESDSENVVIGGLRELRGCRLSSFGDHRTAMSVVVAALKAEGSTILDDIACISKSFPGFPQLIKSLIIY
jgi:3-phosphoshikimate 1-carboxyvinyltransferase